MEDHRGEFTHTPPLAALCESCHQWRSARNVCWILKRSKWLCVWCCDQDDELGTNLHEWLKLHPQTPANEN